MARGNDDVQRDHVMHLVEHGCNTRRALRRNHGRCTDKVFTEADVDACIRHLSKKGFIVHGRYSGWRVNPEVPYYPTCFPGLQRRREREAREAR